MSDSVHSDTSSLIYFKRIGSPVVALATASGGPIGVLRVSGRSLEFLESLIGALPNAGEFSYRSLREPSGDVIDRGLVLFFKGPHSYTGEDVVEIQTHGVAALLEKIQNAICRAGASPALPGEFTFRAVHNGKMSLASAEALQTALSTEGLEASWASKLLSVQESAQGDVQRRLDESLKALASARGRVEAAIDFSEAEVEQAEDIASALEKVQLVRESLSRLLTSYEAFCASAGEPRVAIVGVPNVGKSTLLNLLCGGPRALVSEMAGTTRDVVEGRLRLASGRWVRIYDTAGLREVAGEASAHDRLEREGIARGVEAAESAAVLIYVRKVGSSGDLEDWQSLLARKPVIEIFTHADQAPGGPVDRAFDLRQADSRAEAYVLRALEAALARASTSTDFDLVISARQGQLLGAAIAEIERAEECLRGQRPLELAGDSLRSVEQLIKKTLGQGLGDEYIGEIFSQFCLGK